MPQFSHRYKPQRVIAEPRSKLSASVVGHLGDLEHCAADPYPAARGQVAGRKIKVQDEAISEQGEGLAIGNELGHTLLHDRNLHVLPGLGGTAPGVARNPCLRGQDDLVQDLSPAAFAPPHQQNNMALVLTRGGQSLQRLDQLREGSESIRLPDRI
jgi:hypothetical protein